MTGWTIHSVVPRGLAAFRGRVAGERGHLARRHRHLAGGFRLTRNIRAITSRRGGPSGRMPDGAGWKPALPADSELPSIAVCRWRNWPALVVLLCAVAAGPARAERDRLYTAPDPSATGGIRGRIVSPAQPLRQVLAIPADQPELVYEAKLGDEGPGSFVLAGLPMRKYDLVVIFDDRFYEGLSLSLTEDTLTDEDRQKIAATIEKSEPFFTVKVVHRVEGTTGRAQFARCICTYLRDRASTNGSQFRRTFKLVVMKDVGPGWQVARARDLYPVWASPEHGRPVHRYEARLGRIRVTDRMEDLGGLTLAEN
jgi:hypothetical protein